MPFAALSKLHKVLSLSQYWSVKVKGQAQCTGLGCCTSYIFLPFPLSEMSLEGVARYNKREDGGGGGEEERPNTQKDITS